MRDRRSEALTRLLAAAWTDADASPLRVRRRAAQLSQAELASKAAVGVATVDRAERGHASDASWRRLAVALGTSRADIDRAYAAALAPFLREHDC